MADTGEDRQIVVRANAKEAETVRKSIKMVAEERSTERAADASFGNHKDSENVSKPKKHNAHAPKTSKR